jgi:hypothetical protein
MKLRKNIITAILAASAMTSGLSNAAVPPVAEVSLSRGCTGEFKRKIDDYFVVAIPGVCSQLDTENKYEDSPYMWINPDASCDLGLSMPGLPNIGFGLDGFDSCKILKAVTGDMVEKVNQEMRGAVDEALQEITDGKTQFDLDLTDIAIGEIEGGG